MDEVAPFHVPGEPTISKLHYYSKGIVAANKALKTSMIEVLPIEEFTMGDGYLDATTEKLEATAIDASGKEYTSSVKAGRSIQAKWLRLGDANRLSAPDVRRGESVIIYQYGDADQYFWMTMGEDHKFRRLETVIWGISATPTEDVALNASNMYYIEFSSHTKKITLHVSKANDEFCGYDIQINAKDGKIVISDTIGNSILMDSQANRLNMTNVDGSYVDILGTTMKLFAKTMNMESDQHTVKTGTLNIHASSMNVSQG